MMLVGECPSDAHHHSSTDPPCQCFPRVVGPRLRALCFLPVAAAATKFRPLLDRLSPLVVALSGRLPPLPRWLCGARPCRNIRPWLLVLIVVSLFMMVLLSYSVSYGPGPLGRLIALRSANRSRRVHMCSLACRHVPPGTNDPTWRPRLVPMEYACMGTAILPVPCAPNASSSNYIYSEILRMPPIQFLPNYRNPCWYEDLSNPTTTTPSSSSSTKTTRAAAGAADTEGASPVNPYYSHNLFACFAHSIRRLFLEMTYEFQVRENRERELGTGRGPRRLRCLPYFYIAGMPKSGSTDLYRKVMHHPDVIRPPYKEPHWWSKNRFGMRLNYSSAIPVSDYIELFDNAALQIEKRTQSLDHGRSRKHRDDDPMQSQDRDGLEEMEEDEEEAEQYHHAITLDGSASTFWNNDEWWRLPENCGLSEPRFTNAHHIHRLTPGARIIVILRNPTDRLFSDYLYFTKMNKSAANFHQDVKESIEKLRQCMAIHTFRACIYDKQVANGKAKVRLRVGVYHVYLSDWLDVFSPEQLLVLRTEDYSKFTRRTIQQVFRFLGLRPLRRAEESDVLDLPKANTRRLSDRDVGPMWEETRHALRDFYQPHNQELARLLHDKRFLWNDNDAKVLTGASPKRANVTPSPRGAAASPPSVRDAELWPGGTTGGGEGGGGGVSGDAGLAETARTSPREEE